MVLKENNESDKGLTKKKVARVRLMKRVQNGV